MKKHIVAVAVSSCLSTMVMADEPDLNNVSADQGVVLDNIVVSGEKQRRSLKDTTSSVSVINAENLDQYQNLHDAISAVPNLVVQTGVVPNVRGITGNGRGWRLQLHQRWCQRPLYNTGRRCRTTVCR